MLQVTDILSKLVREIAGTRSFYGCESDPLDHAATVVLATACSSYIIDVDEEVNWEDEITCYNCRYRRWNSYGFSCYKNFPLK